MRSSEGQKKIELNQMILEWEEMRSVCLCYGGCEN